MGRTRPLREEIQHHRGFQQMKIRTTRWIVSDPWFRWKTAVPFSKSDWHRIRPDAGRGLQKYDVASISFSPPGRPGFIRGPRFFPGSSQ
jgi:hypothetical protein